MAKVKNKKNAGLADKVHAKKKDGVNKKKLNPFEVHINKEKIKVLGKKSKHDRGLPGVSRAKAIQKRKETIGTEMKIMNKTNTFIDRRIGEKNNQLSAEDRMVARFAAERAKQHGKKNIYNLADDEVLTHRGQTLEQIEKFDDPRSSDDEDAGNKFGGLDDDFVSEGHFGGGMLSKSDAKDGAKSHKDLIEQLIAESKKRKAEKQKEKEQTLDLTEKLDSEWKDLQPVVLKKQKVEEESLIDKLLNKAEKGQDYDTMMRELRFEKRGTPSDGLKATEKQQEEERRKLEELEKQRHLRMLSEEELPKSKTVQPATKHRSADDLDDNLDLKDDDDDKEFILAYNKYGRPLVPEHILKDYSVPNAKKKFDDGISDTSSDDDDESEEERETEENETNDRTKIKKDSKEAESEEESQESSKEDSDENEDSDEKESEGAGKSNSGKNDSDSEEDKGSPDEESSDSESEAESQKNQSVKSKTEIKKTKDDSNDKSKGKTGDTPEENCKIETDLNVKKPKVNGVSKPEEQVEDSHNEEDSQSEEDSNDEADDDKEVEKKVEDDYLDLRELKEESESEEESVENAETFITTKSTESDNLKKMLEGKTPSQQSVVVKSLIKRYDPGLSENNKELLSCLFAHLAEYLNYIFMKLTNEGEVIESFVIFDKFVPHFYQIVHTNRVSTKRFVVHTLKGKRDSFIARPKKVPDLHTLVFFKLISLLYPTSDFRHPVTTPTLIFMTEILSLSRFRDRYSISRGLFITSLILEFIFLSKRYVPEALNFLRGILYLCANTSVLNPIQIVPPFRLHKDMKILNLENDCSSVTVEKKMLAKDFVLDEIDDDFKIRCLLNATLMLRELFDNYIELEALSAIFGPHLQLLDRVDLDLYPGEVAREVTKVVQHLKQSLEVKTYTPLAREKVRPKALRLYEPDIQEVFTGSKNPKLSRDKAARERLKTKHKKEMKGALRELRRDKAYIASVKIREKIQSDNIRKEKVKQIYKDASIQQGELNKLKRMK